MSYIFRKLQPLCERALARGKSILLLGARQTGKTTLVNQFRTDMTVSLVPPAERLRYEQFPDTLSQEVTALRTKSTKPLVVIDEVQRVPALLDVVQHLIDSQAAQFILTGSSARKLKRGHSINLLPGRVVAFTLDPFMLGEYATPPKLKDVLLYGSLPGVLLTEAGQDKEMDLKSYVVAYLDEEIRAEALVRNVGHFARFLHLAASESGNILNFRKLASDIGLASTTIATYYEILEDCLIMERIMPYTQCKTRRALTKSDKFLFFDLGVRRVAAEEGTEPPRETWGRWLEQWVGLELIRMARLSLIPSKICYWRDPNGPEVDWVLVQDGTPTPIEVKWTDKPDLHDIKHLRLFKEEYPASREAFLICRVPRPLMLAEGIKALPWQALEELVVEK